ncbi:hypothetical protein D3C83_321730 [compost metagenome]
MLAREKKIDRAVVVEVAGNHVLERSLRQDFQRNRRQGGGGQDLQGALTLQAADELWVMIVVQ